MKSTPRLGLQLFNEEAVEPVVETQVTEETVEQPVDNVDNQTTEEAEAFLEIQYNKEQMKLDREKAVELAQKGMNYDKVYEKATTYEQELEQLKSSGEMKFMQDFLKNNGYESFAEYENALALDKIQQEKPHLTKEEAEELYAGRREREQRQKAMAEKETKQQQEQKTIEAITRYEEKYGTLDVNSLDKEILAMYDKGIDLVIARELHELRNGTNRTKIEQETMEKLQNNQASSTGSATKGAVDHNTSYASMSKSEFEAAKQEVLRRQR